MNPDPTNPASTGTGAGGGSIDMQVIQGLRDLGGEDEPDLVEELIDIFLQDAPQRMKDISEGIASGDLGRVERGAHTLKSSSANIGALRLSEICREIVERARTNRMQSLPQLCQASARSLAQAVVELRNLKV